MNLSRREILLAGLGMAVTGCTQRLSRKSSFINRPGTIWPDSISRPGGETPVVRVPPASPIAPSVPTLKVISRSHWASRGPVMSRINPMNGVTRMTAHHEGWHAIWFTDWAQTARRIEDIRRYHVEDRGWADIGYHYVIDRAGRLWEGRPVKFQGAHVKDHNEHNVGVMCLGNFDLQRPSTAQMATLRNTLRTLKHHYSVPITRVYTHQELMPTRCPGASLQPRVAYLRSAGYLA